VAARSQNGWPIVGRDMLDRDPLIRNVTVPNGVLKGHVAIVFRWLAREYDRRVEPLTAGWCWGWLVKPIEGSGVASNHGSGTAVDFNAPNNPMGPGTTRKSMTTAQIATCHQLEQESGGVLRWGGDFTRNDPMHWEVVGSPAEVAALARKITTPVRTPVMQKITVSVPLLEQGDDDDELAGYNLIGRIQAIVGAKRDGAWGPLTTAAIAAWLKRPEKDCRVLSEQVYRDIFGAAR
jgi:hypothetical protein